MDWKGLIALHRWAQSWTLTQRLVLGACPLPAVPGSSADAETSCAGCEGELPAPSACKALSSSGAVGAVVA